jgi:hypothetical protein
MKDQLISQFIDDELDLDEKLDFVNEVSANAAFKNEAVELLAQEKLLVAQPFARVPEISFEEARPKVRWSFFKPLATGAFAGLLIFIGLAHFTSPPVPNATPCRFVIYQPKATQVDLVGSFSGWKAVPLKNAGQSGYWETTLNLPPGEYRFSYVVGGHERVADPTIVARENDDFGGENSILMIKS